MTRPIRFVLLAMMLWMGRTAFAHTPELEGKRVEGVILVTPPGHDPRDLYRFVEIRKGDAYSAAKVRRSIEVLSKLGDFSGIRVDAQDAPGGVFLTFQLTPVPLIRKIVLHGVPRTPARVLNALGVTAGSPFPGESALDHMRDQVQQAYFRDGWRSAVVTVVAAPAPEGDVDLSVTVEEGIRLFISKIDFNGDLAFSPEELVKASGLTPGMPVKVSLLETARRKLSRLHRHANFLEVRIPEPTLAPDPEGAPGASNVFFTVNSGEQIEVAFHRKPVAWKDQKRDPLWFWTFRDSRLLETLELDSETQFTEGFGEESSDRMASYYRRHGYLEAKVAATLEVNPAKRLKLFRYEIDPGRRFELKDIRFKGNDETRPELSSKALRGEVLSQSPLLKQGFFAPEEVEPVIEELINYLRSQGYTDARVDAEDPHIDHQRHRVELLFDVEAGSRSTVGNLTFQGNVEAPSVKLQQVIGSDPVGLKPGEPLNAVYLDRADVALEEYYASIGFPYARAAHAAVAGTNGAVNVHFEVDEEFQAFVGRIIVKGNRYTRRDVVDRALPFRTGQSYTPQALAAGEDALLKLGTFSRVSAVPFAEEDPERVRDILVGVTEANRIWAEPSIGASSVKGPRVGLNAQHRNLFGSAKSITVRAQANWRWDGLLGDTQGLHTQLAPHVDTTRIEERLLVTYSQPTTFGQPVTSSVTTSLSEREQTRGFGYSGNRVVAAADRSLKLDWGPLRGANVRVLAAYQVFLRDILYHQSQNDDSRERYAALEPQDFSLRKAQQMFYWPLQWRIATLSLGTSADHRNDSFNPTRGYTALLDAQLASRALWSQVNFVKVTGSLSVYQPVMGNWDLVMSTRAGFGQPFGSTGGLPVDQRFHLGDTGSVRGFKEDSIGPRFSNVSAKISTGGDVFGLYNLEARHPVGFGLDGVLFTDAGWSQILHHSDFTTRHEPPFSGDEVEPPLLPGRLVNPKSPSTSIGVGVRAKSPVGPVKLDFGIDTTRVRELDAVDGWRNVRVHFTIGDF